MNLYHANGYWMPSGVGIIQSGTRIVDTRIAELRKALQDDSSSPRYMETVPGEEYCFIGQVIVAAYLSPLTDLSIACAKRSPAYGAA